MVPEEEPDQVPSSCSLADLESFMGVTRTGLKKPLKEGDYDGLVEVMGHLMKVKERQVATDNMFEPLKQTIELLKTYGEEMPEETYLKLQVGPNRAVPGRSLQARHPRDSGSRPRWGGGGGACPGWSWRTNKGQGGPRGWQEPPDGFVGLRPSPRLTSHSECGGHAPQMDVKGDGDWSSERLWR